MKLSRLALQQAGAAPPRPPARIVHLGVGAFHRAHQAWFTQHAVDGEDWGIAAFSMRSAAVSDALAAQEGLYTLVTRAEQDEFELLWSIVEVGNAASQVGRQRVLDLVASAEVAVLTLTITEAGYLSGGPAMRLLLEALLARKAAGSGPLTVLPCDNLSSNGERLRQALLETVRELSSSSGQPATASLAVLDEALILNSSVDRITPRSTDADRTVVELATGWQDAVPVVTEEYASWVLQVDSVERCFPGGHPLWQQAGVRFVQDVEPWERRKLWMLNGAHSYLANAGQLRGYRTVAEAIADPELLGAVQQFWAEAAQHLPAELEAAEYAESLLARFGNPRIEHLLSQIAQDSVVKLQQRVLPVWRAERAAGRSGAASHTILLAWVEAVVAGFRSPDTADPLIDVTLSGPQPAEQLMNLIDQDVAEELP
ncbi:mannitol dehydrogenase family protein [Psychromicrobium lacuslunae]|uniref:mannitol dehydrogenase family protein n=1 Tax=Psychromicrobium lacuslunae TaxID=1618207 RepID=UPI0005D390DA|nr:mannitol dehydrogenase family protein [Psychromicrobium lacuslunae]